METQNTKQCPYCRKEINLLATKCPYCQSAFKKSRGKHDTRNLILTALGIVVLLIVFVAAFDTTNTNTVSPVPSPQPPALSCSTSQAQTIPFKALNKSPDSYKGTLATFTGQIAQIQQQPDGSGMIRLAVTKTDYGYSFNDIIYITYSSANNFVEGDDITVYGTLTGSYTYTSQANYQITIPSMTACDIEKLVTTKPISAPKTSSTVPKSVTTASVIQPVSSTVSTPVVPAVPKSWHTVFTVNNNDTEQTPPFAMQGIQWRITYSCSVADSGNPYSHNFTGFVYNTDGSIANLFANGESCPTSNTSYVYAKDPGQYYLQISPDNVIYSVTVEDYY